MSESCICPIDRTLSGSTTPGKSGPGSNGNEGVFCIRYETIEEMKEAVTKVIDTVTQEDFHGAFKKLLELYNTCMAAEGDFFEGD